MKNSFNSVALPLPSLFKTTKSKRRRIPKDPDWKYALATSVVGVLQSGQFLIPAGLGTFDNPTLVNSATVSALAIFAFNQAANLRTALYGIFGYAASERDKTPSSVQKSVINNLGHSFCSLAALGAINSYDTTGYVLTGTFAILGLGSYKVAKCLPG